MPDTPFEQAQPVPRDEISRILDQVQRLIDGGRFRQAIDLATAANHGADVPELERRIVTWRVDAFASMDHANRPEPWPKRFADPFPDKRGVVEVEFADLTLEILGGALQHHGSLLVRGLTTPEKAKVLQDGIDRAMAARELKRNGASREEIGSWYEETPLNTATAVARGWGGVWLADSPRMMYEVLDLYEKRGLTGIVADYLNEPLTLSIGKSTLRRIEPGGNEHDWHQDGAFLGKEVRTINVWLSLSDCGVDAPGLDIVGERLPGLVESGTHGAVFEWSVGRGVVANLTEHGIPVVSPVFRPGDAMLFDQLMLHRTAVRPEMTKTRYAIESWFFTPSTFPMEQGPLMV
jgi:Phytanoyl-CoA dioxygenase (PhyH)